jgi:hypothetical protein
VVTPLVVSVTSPIVDEVQLPPGTTVYVLPEAKLPDAANIRMVGNLLGDPKIEVPFDAEVKAIFEDHPEGFTLIQWKLANR